MMGRMEHDIRQHFEREAVVYDEIIRALIPDYSEMLQALVNVVPFDAAIPIRVLDLGCGTGALTHAVLSAFPTARVTCVDIAAPMIEIARAKPVVSGH